MEALTACARENGIELIYPDVRSDHASAIHLYQKYGFRKTGTYPAFFKIGDAYHDFDLMVRDLRQPECFSLRIPHHAVKRKNRMKIHACTAREKSRAFPCRTRRKFSEFKEQNPSPRQFLCSESSRYDTMRKQVRPRAAGSIRVFGGMK